jgi:hypothetical protein
LRPRCGGRFIKLALRVIGGATRQRAVVPPTLVASLVEAFEGRPDLRLHGQVPTLVLQEPRMGANTVNGKPPLGIVDEDLADKIF